MASTKEMQRRAKARKLMQKAMAENAVKMHSHQPVKLYKTEELLHDCMGLKITQTPEGVQAYKTAIVNIAYIPKGKMMPTEVWMTGYGASYMSKVMMGTPRADERMMNAFLDGDEHGDMLQISYTQVGEKEEEILLIALHSLGQRFCKDWSLRYIKTEYGSSPTPLGWVRA